MTEFSQTVPELVAWARKNDFSLSLPIDLLAFVLAIATLNSERGDGEMSEGESVDAFRYVSEGFEQTQETVTVRANNGVFQDRYRFYAARQRSFSGLRATMLTGVQLRVFPDQRSGCWHRAVW